MKKMIALLLAAVMVFSLAACGSSTSDTKKETQAPADTQADTAAEETKAPESADAVESTEAAEESAESSDAAATGTEGKLIMATEAGFAPYEYTEDGQTVVGVDVDIANEIAKAMGKELEIQNMTFDGALLAVQQGKADFAAAGISVTEERQAVMDFSIEYATSKQVVVINTEAARVPSVDALTGELIIGVQAGTVADYYCDDMGWTNKRQYNKFMEAALDLKNDKIDCIIMDSLPAEQIVAENPELSILDGEVFTDKYAIAVEKGNTEMLEQINEVLQKLLDEGKIDEYTINHTTK